MKRMKRCVLIILLVSLVFSLAGCNTIRGFGKDVQKGGEEIQDITRE
jgi:entericidin A